MSRNREADREEESRARSTMNLITSRNRDAEEELAWPQTRNLLARGFRDLSAVTSRSEPQLSDTATTYNLSGSNWAGGPLYPALPTQMHYSNPSTLPPSLPPEQYCNSYATYPSTYPPFPQMMSGAWPSQQRFAGTSSSVGIGRFPRSATPTSMPAQMIVTCGSTSKTISRTVPVTAGSSYYAEHRRLFGYGGGLSSGYKPSHSAITAKAGKGPKSKYSGKAKQLSRLLLWKKEVMCLRCKDAAKIPDVQEKIALAKLGLTVKEVKFDINGDAWHFDAIIKEAFPELQSIGGYSLLRVGTANSLIVIDPPKGGFNIRYLKDIVQSARLYIRPLQNDIQPGGDMESKRKDLRENEDEEKLDEPCEFCNVCDELIPLTNLQKHVKDCKRLDVNTDIFVSKISPQIEENVSGNRKSIGESNQSSDLQELVEMVPQFNYNFINAVYQLSNQDFAAAFDCLHTNNGTLEAVLALMKEKFSLNDENEDPPRIRIGSDKIEDWVESAFSFYKSQRFSTSCGVRISIQGNPGIDAGGVRRDFYSRVYEKIATGYLGIFEGKPSNIRPTYTLFTLTSDTLKYLGIMVAHSILMDKIGFPFLSPSIYYYMANRLDTAITLITDNDVSDKTKYILKEIRECSGELQHLLYAADAAELLEQSGGNDIPFKAQYKEEIIQVVLINEGLFKRKLFMDSFMDGLDVFHLKKIIQSNPQLFEPMFVNTKKISVDEVKKIISTEAPPGDDVTKLKILHAVGAFLDECCEKDLENFLLYCTGSKELIGNELTIAFSDKETSAAVSVNTCNKTISISTRIKPILALIDDLKHLIKDDKFTIP